MSDGVPVEAPPRRPRRTAIITALAWQVPVAILLVVAIVVALTQDDAEGWGDLAAVVLTSFGFGGIVVSGAFATVFAVLFTRGGRASTGAAVGWGTLAAVLGWVLAFGVLTAFSLLMRTG